MYQRSRAGLLAVVSSFLLLCAAPAAAEDEGGTWNDWYIGTQATYVDTDDDRLIDDAGGVTLTFGRTLNDWFDLELVGNYTVLERDLPGDGSDIDFRAGLGLDLLWVLDRDGWGGFLVPHLAIGAGVAHNDASIRVGAMEILDEEETSPYAGAGFGFRIPVIDNGLKLRFDARYIVDFAEYEFNQGGGNTRTADNFGDVHVSVGVELPLGGKVAAAPTDSDNDGVPDNRDQCPNTPPGVPVGPDGCPLDSDGDGVPDYQDQCPGTPAGVAVGPDGCPLDSDGDGVPDYQDQCPGTPTGTPVGPDGCAIDSDGDGVPDYLDQCPGTQAGLEVDEQGCAVAFQTIILQNINFEFDKSTLLPSSKPFLEGLANTMKGQPSMRVKLKGHTDAIGSDAYNQKLSERRAQAVKDYLVALGIAPDRLETEGYGESQPIASNTNPDGSDNPEGRALNRRTELEVLAK